MNTHAMGRYFTHAALLLSLVFITYSNTLGNRFVWDDVKLIQENVKIQQLKYIPRYFTSDYFDRPTAPSHGGLSQQYWRPLILLSFAFDFQFWAGNPMGYHLANILFHALNALLVMALLRMLPATRLIALPAALLFALHPLQTNVVAFISGRTDLVACTFFLLSCMCVVRHAATPAGNRCLTAATAFFLAMSLMAKETLLVAPLIYVLLGSYAPASTRRRIGQALVAAVLLLVAYLALRTLLQLPLGNLRVALRHVTVSTLLASAKSIISFIRLFILPTGLHADRVTGVSSGTDAGGICAALLIVLLVAAAARSLATRGTPGFGSAWFLAALLPMSNIIPLYPGISDRQIYCGEQFMYIPSIGLSIAAAALMHAALRHACAYRRALTACGGTILLLFGMLTYAHNDYWRDEATFYARTLRFSPDNSRMLLNLGVSYATQGRYDDALQMLRLAVRKNPGWAIGHSVLGAVCAMAGGADEARNESRRAVELDPMLASAHYNLGMLAGTPEEAAAHYERAVAVSPLYTQARIRLAELREAKGDSGGAIRTLEEALTVDPSSADARFLLNKIQLEGITPKIPTSHQ